MSFFQTKNSQGALRVLVILGILLTPSVVMGQSVLSLAPPSERAEDTKASVTIIRSEGEGISGNGLEKNSEEDENPASTPAELKRFYELVADGKGHEAYPALLRIDREELSRRSPSQQRSEGERERLISLLRAGEGLANPTDQEFAARRFVEHYPDNEAFPIAFFYLNEALYLQGRTLEDSFFFDDAAFTQLPGWMQSRYLRMKASTHIRHGRGGVAAELLLKEMKGGDTLRETKPEEVLDALALVKNTDTLESFAIANPGESWLTEAMPLLRVRAMVNQGDISTALLALASLTEGGQDATPEQIKALHSIRQEIEKRVLTSAGKIGVLLPLSSSSRLIRQLAVEVLDGLRMGVQFPDAMPGLSRPTNSFLMAGLDFSTKQVKPLKNKAGVPSIELVVRDTGNNPERAAKMVEELIVKEKVMAIIGPIARRESQEAASRADALGVPLISFSLTLDMPPGTKYVFRHSKSQEGEVRDLVRYAMDYQGAKRFAILHPEGGYGRTMADLFWEEVRRKGGKVVAIEEFESWRGQPDSSGARLGLKAIFERITGMDRPVSPEDQKLIDELGDDRPDPIVNFDALFVPVGPNGDRDLALIAPYPVTVDAENVLLLGTRFWNTDGVVVSADGKLDGAVFVDAYDRRSRLKKMREFHKTHLLMYGHRVGYRSPPYFTALAYDTLTIVQKLIAKQENRNPVALAEAMISMKAHAGVTGLTAFRETGEAMKESMFFTIRDDSIRRIVP